jgi:hypothetical protein
MSYTAQQFSDYLGVERGTFHSWIRRGIIDKSTSSSMFGRKGGPETKLWGREYVLSLNPEEMRKKGRLVVRRVDTFATTDLFNLVLKTSSAIGA